MYHSVSGDLDDSRHPFFRTVTSPATFESHIRLMQKEGLQGINLTQALSMLHTTDVNPADMRNKVVITFDDGFRDFLLNAYPVLSEAGYSSTMFVATAFIGKQFLNGRPCLNSSELRMLGDSDVEIGSHSVTHQKLVQHDDVAVRRELAASRETLENILGRKVSTFSYPFGFPEENADFVDSLRAALEDTGYLGGVTTCIGTASYTDEPLFLPRLPINECDDAPLFRAKLDGRYDWLRTAQRVKKQSHALFSSSRTI